jgi:hypothetical protein
MYDQKRYYDMASGGPAPVAIVPLAGKKTTVLVISIFAIAMYLISRKRRIT